MTVSGVARSAVDAQLGDKIYVAVEMMPYAYIKVVQHLINQSFFGLTR